MIKRPQKVPPLFENVKPMRIAMPTPKAVPRRSPRLTKEIRVPLYTPPADRQTSPAIITQDAINALTHKVMNATDDTHFIPRKVSPQRDHDPAPAKLEHFCSPVVHRETGETITNYRKLIKDPLYREVWMTAFGKEFGNLAQGDRRTGTKGTNTVFILGHDEIKNIPKDRVVTYGRIVIDYRPQKDDPNRVRITAGGNLISYPGELTTRTADLTTSKVLWNSVLSTKDAKYMCVDISSFYLTAPMERYEYMRMPLEIFPEHTIEQYDLKNKAKNGWVYLEIRRSIYGLPQSGILANRLLRKRLAPTGILSAPTRRVYGSTSLDQSLSPSWSTILV